MSIDLLSELLLCIMESPSLSNAPTNDSDEVFINFIISFLRPGLYIMPVSCRAKEISSSMAAVLHLHQTKTVARA